MAKRSQVMNQIPAIVNSQLRLLGENIQRARLRRNMTLNDLAMRVGVARTTLIRLEKGLPTASLGVLATTLWVLGLDSTLHELANPEKDEFGKFQERQYLRQKASGKKRAKLAKGASTILDEIEGLDY